MTTDAHAPPPTTSAALFRIYVIESPGDLDLMRGRGETEPLRRVLEQADVPHKHWLVINRARLGDVFVEIMRDMLDGNRIRPATPVLHFSSHGSKQGIALTSGELMTWGELQKPLALLNKFVDGRLMLCLSTCEGVSAFQMAGRADAEQPFHTLVGPTTKIRWQDSLVAFVAFYHLISHKSADHETAASSMNVAAGLPPKTFMSVTSKEVADFLRTLDSMTPEQFAEKIRAVTSALR